MDECIEDATTCTPLSKRNESLPKLNCHQLSEVACSSCVWLLAPVKEHPNSVNLRLCNCPCVLACWAAACLECSANLCEVASAPKTLLVGIPSVDRVGADAVSL